MWPCIATNFFIIKKIRCTNFPNLLRHDTLHVSGSSSAHHREFIHCTLRTGICHTGLKTVFEQGRDGTEFHPGPARNLWMNSRWWAEELPETCRVSCWSKFGKLVHLVCFITKKFYVIFILPCQGIWILARRLFKKIPENCVRNDVCMSAILNISTGLL